MTLSASLESVSQSAKVVFKGGGGRSVTVRANGSDLFLTAIVTMFGEAAAPNPDVALAGSGEPVSGVIIAQSFPYLLNLAKDSDDTFDDNAFLLMYVPEGGDQLYLTAKTATSISKNNWFKADGGFIIESTKGAALGRVLIVVTGISGTEQIILCEWGVDA